MGQECRAGDQESPAIRLDCGPIECAFTSRRIYEPYLLTHMIKESLDRYAGMENDRVGLGRTMLWTGVIGGLIVGVLIMYGVWVLLRKMDD